VQLLQLYIVNLAKAEKIAQRSKRVKKKEREKSKSVKKKECKKVIARRKKAKK
jgi:hypothetical protein